MPMTLLVDIGNVLVRFDYQKLIHWIDPAADDSLLDPLLALRDQFETGLLSIDKFLAVAESHLPIQGRVAEFSQAWCQIFTPIPEMNAQVESWKQAGHHLVLFSNINPLHHEFLASTYPWFAAFDHAILSYQVGGMKPDPPMYRHAVEVLQLNPKETLYLDDLAANLAAGREWGFATHQVDWTQPDCLERIQSTVRDFSML